VGTPAGPPAILPALRSKRGAEAFSQEAFIMNLRYLIQAACVLAIALGAGLFAFGSYLDPQLDMSNPAQVVRNLTHEDREMHVIASTACGVGVGFMTLGGLGLVVPWVNVLVQKQIGRLDSEAPSEYK